METANETANDSECSYCGTPVWFSIGILITIITILGNVLTISSILLSKRLSLTIANYFVFSLAVSDCFVGFFVPYHMLFYVDPTFSYREIPCLLRFSFICFASSSSICNLVLIAADRYVAIIYPFRYTRFLTKKIAFRGIAIAWLAAFLMASVPIFWNQWENVKACEIYYILPINYIRFLLCPMFVAIWLTMLFLYMRICKEATGHEKRLRNSTSTCSSLQYTVQLKESKSLKMTLMILGCFTICWLPYFSITLFIRLNKTTPTWSSLYEICFNLAMLNSGLNPLIYAWKNSGFRRAFKFLLKCQAPELNSTHYITNHVPSKKNSLNGISSVHQGVELPAVFYSGVQKGITSNDTAVTRDDAEQSSTNDGESGLHVHVPKLDEVKAECEIHQTGDKY